MCIKSGNSELSSVKALMTMSLNAIIADTFDVELDDIQRSMRLCEDLNMDGGMREQLAEQVAEYFDGLTLDFNKIQTVADLFDIVVDQEFQHVPSEYL